MKLMVDSGVRRVSAGVYPDFMFSDGEASPETNISTEI